jgi:uncharacterized protein YutE (UPF0331/DUF86 family)
MVNSDLVAAKLTELSGRVNRVKEHCPVSQEALAADQDACDLVSFNLMLAVQVCADIASQIISDEGWPAARNLAEGFQRLADRGVVSRETADTLCLAVGLRNVVAHGYTRIDHSMLFAAASHGVDDLDSFAREIAGWVQGSCSDTTAGS